jgi:hypothetical protein
VGCVIVHDEMNVHIVGNSGFDLIEKLAELCGAMAPIALCLSEIKLARTDDEVDEVRREMA